VVEVCNPVFKFLDPRRENIAQVLYVPVTTCDGKITVLILFIILSCNLKQLASVYMRLCFLWFPLVATLLYLQRFNSGKDDDNPSKSPLPVGHALDSSLEEATVRFSLRTYEGVPMVWKTCNELFFDLTRNELAALLSSHLPGCTSRRKVEIGQSSGPV
jgi:hypothetical protein